MHIVCILNGRLNCAYVYSSSTEALLHVPWVLSNIQYCTLKQHSYFPDVGVCQIFFPSSYTKYEEHISQTTPYSTVSYAFFFFLFFFSKNKTPNIWEASAIPTDVESPDPKTFMSPLWGWELGCCTVTKLTDKSPLVSVSSFFFFFFPPSVPLFCCSKRRHKMPHFVACLPPTSVFLNHRSLQICIAIIF